MFCSPRPETNTTTGAGLVESDASVGVPVNSPAFAGTHLPTRWDGQAELTWVVDYI